MYRRRRVFEQLNENTYLVRVNERRRGFFASRNHTKKEWWFVLIRGLFFFPPPTPLVFTSNTNSRSPFREQDIFSKAKKPRKWDIFYRCACLRVVFILTLYSAHPRRLETRRHFYVRLACRFCILFNYIISYYHALCDFSRKKNPRFNCIKIELSCEQSPPNFIITLGDLKISIQIENVWKNFLI